MGSGGGGCVEKPVTLTLGGGPGRFLRPDREGGLRLGRRGRGLLAAADGEDGGLAALLQRPPQGQVR